MPRIFVKLVILWSLPILCLGEAVVDPDSYDEKARAEYVKKFTDFTKDINVMGTANTPTGTLVQSKGKTTFNRDDRNNFQNDLTYHKNTFDQTNKIPDPANPGKTKDEKLPMWVSVHGKVAKGGGSSVLEREVYKWHEKFMKDDAKPGAPKPKKGVDYESIFKITTEDVIPKKPGGTPPTPPPGGGSTPPPGAIPVKRYEIREEAKEAIEKVGENSYNSIAKAAKDPQSKNDAKVMPSLSFLYESARRGLEAMWNSTTSSLAQKRVSRNLEDQGATGGLNEDTADCMKWSQNAMASFMKKKPAPTPAEIKNYQKDIDKQTNECKQLIATNYNSVNPEFEDPASGSGPRTLKKDGDIKVEDDKERDMRVQLNVLAKAGIRLKDIPSFKKYNDKDERTKVVLSYDDQGNPQETKMLRVDEQIDMYNSELDAAAKDYGEVKKRMPDLNIKEEDILKNKIKMKSKRIDQITRINKPMAEELGLKSSLGQKTLTDKYEEIYSSKPKVAGETGEGSTYIDFTVDPKPVKAGGADTLYIDEGKK